MGPTPLPHIGGENASAIKYSEANAPHSHATNTQLNKDASSGWALYYKRNSTLATNINDEHK